MTESDSTQPRPRGHVEATPEARPLPPAWRDHFQGPIPGMPAPSGPGAGAQAAGQSGQAQPANQGGSGAASQPAPAAQSSAGQTAASPPLEPHPAFQPDVNRPIPLYGDRQDQAGGAQGQRRTGWDAGDLLKPLAAGAALLAIAGVRLAARGVAHLADALASRRRQ